jgi:hypothetical protein
MNTQISPSIIKYRQGYSGNISFTGAGISNRVISKVRYGNISFTGAGASNVVERIGGDQGV